jgi:hypothetical protein
VHNFIPEYASTASILKLFEKKFLKKWFCPQISSNPQVLKRQSMKKKRKKRESSKCLSSNKRGSQYFERRKTLQLQKFFLMWFYFLPLHHTISKTLFKIIEKYFLTIFGPFFSLAIYSWAPHIYPLEGRMGRNIYWAEVRNHTSKRVFECLMLRNHNNIISYSLRLISKRG